MKISCSNASSTISPNHVECFHSFFNRMKRIYIYIIKLCIPLIASLIWASKFYAAKIECSFEINWQGNTIWGHIYFAGDGT